ncbi:effector-associated constant component EACC1 [Kitasatospora aureofaciens]|uniref:effector-associated constant component EACC1 n=1 Tax=Kitasatospora aureofaciens TaxID=1894 RepID=UPI0007C43F99|nr:hypothetical protein [Kitasatospora aureofaciens]
MDLTLTAAGGQGADELRSLQAWLADVDELRGRVALVESPPVPGTLGPVLDALVVALGPGGAATALATAVFSWIRQRRGEVTLKISRPDGAAVEISAKRVQGIDGSSLRLEVASATRQVRKATAARTTTTPDEPTAAWIYEHQTTIPTSSSCPWPQSDATKYSAESSTSTPPPRSGRPMACGKHPAQRPDRTFDTLQDYGGVPQPGRQAAGRKPYRQVASVRDFLERTA